MADEQVGLRSVGAQVHGDRFEPDYDLSLTLDNEQDRVIFIKTAALFFIQTARIKVNPKKLYQADGWAAAARVFTNV